MMKPVQLLNLVLVLAVSLGAVAASRAVGPTSVVDSTDVIETHLREYDVTETVPDQRGMSATQEATTQQYVPHSDENETYIIDQSNEFKTEGSLLQENNNDGTCIYPDFSSMDGLNLIDDAHQSTENNLRLTRARQSEVGSAWCINKQFVQDDFETTFQFQITGWSTEYGSADGFAFVIQNSSISALGNATGDIGYGGSITNSGGITNSLAIEFDTKTNGDRNDPNNDHIGIQTCEIDPNSAYHDGCSLGLAASSDLDIGVHTATIKYLPGTMQVLLDSSPLLTVSVDLAAALNLDNGKAWVGFTAATEDRQEDGWGNHDILSWAFYPAYDLSVKKSASVAAAKVDTSLMYTITAANYGPLDITGVVLTDTLPLSVTLDLKSVTSGQGNCMGTTALPEPNFVCYLGTLSSGATITVTAVATPTTAGMITNIASVIGNETDPNLNNNVAIENTPVCIQPVVDFVAAPLSGLRPPLTVVFTDTSTGTVDIWEWDFGNGRDSSVQHPQETYQEAGVYTVTLTTYCHTLYTDTKRRSNYIDVGPCDPPVARNVEITPSVDGIASDSANLNLDYDYDDPDHDPEGNSIIVWTRDGTYQPALNNQRVVANSHTLPGEQWCASITPYEMEDPVCGSLFGETVEACVHIEYIPNHPPQAFSITITPTSPTYLDDLRLTYVYTDTDDDPEGDTEIRWHRNGMFQRNLTDTIVPSDTTTLGNIWYATVRPQDGEDYGAEASSNYVVIGPTDNHPPVATNVIITPTQPGTDNDLELLDGYYSDSDGDPEGDTEIRWFRNGDLQTANNNITVVPAIDTLPGEIWHATVRPHDGKDYGVLVESPPVSISSGVPAPPEVRDVRITPIRPGDDSDLRLTYIFLDVNGDPEGSSLINWYKNGQVQDAYDGLTVIPHGDTAVGDIWFAIVTPHDGTDYGAPVAAHSVDVGTVPDNTPPEARNVHLSPGQPGDDNCLELYYTYYDKDDDPEWATVITWTLNGITNSAYSNQTFAPASATSVGETWCASVTPHDGEEPGQLVKSNSCITVALVFSNTPPEAQKVYIKPAHPLLGDRLRLHYTYFDVDHHPESESQIRWYRNGGLVPAYNDRTIAVAGSRGEEWFATVKVHDGTDCGTMMTTPVVIVNRLPQAIGVTLTPTQPNTCQSLALTYVYTDTDDDPEGSSLINWYCDGRHQTKYDGQRQLPARATSAGEHWHTAVIPHDDFEYGQSEESNTVTIVYADCPPIHIYLPIILRNYPPGHDLFYEQNDSWKQAYGPLLPGYSYYAYPDDENDCYYFELDETSSIEVQVADYTALGQLLVYYYDKDNDNIERLKPCKGFRDDPDGPPMMEVPNDISCFEGELNNLVPGTYYVRIYSSGYTNTNQLYSLVWACAVQSSH